MELPHHIQKRLERRWLARHEQDRKIPKKPCHRPNENTDMNLEPTVIADTGQTLRAER